MKLCGKSLNSFISMKHSSWPFRYLSCPCSHRWGCGDWETTTMMWLVLFRMTMCGFRLIHWAYRWLHLVWVPRFGLFRRRSTRLASRDTRDSSWHNSLFVCVLKVRRAVLLFECARCRRCCPRFHLRWNFRSRLRNTSRSCNFPGWLLGKLLSSTYHANPTNEGLVMRHSAAPSGPLSWLWMSW